MGFSNDVLFASDVVGCVMTRRVRLLFIVPRFATVSRGVETFVFELISRLDLARFAVTVLSAKHEASVSGITFETAPSVSREKLSWLDRMPWLVRCLRPFGLGGGADIEALTLLSHFRHHWSQDAFDVVVPLGGIWSYRFACKAFPGARIVGIGQAGPVPQHLVRSDIFVGLTPCDEERVSQMRLGMRTCVIPNGVDTKRFSPAKPRVRTKERVIICAAALVPDKRHDLLFDAVLRLPLNVRVLCVGAGPHQAVLARHPLARDGRVEFCQYSFAEMPDVYRKADVFSLASPDEAFGIVFIEAMACGLPVVAHHGPRQQFVVNGGGILCDVHNSDAYAEALRAVMDAAPSEKARAQAAKFDWSEIVPKYDLLFGESCSVTP